MADDIKIILKHRETGELLGYSAPFSVPTVAVYAKMTKEGWEEVKPN